MLLHRQGYGRKTPGRGLCSSELIYLIAFIIPWGSRTAGPCSSNMRAAHNLLLIALPRNHAGKGNNLVENTEPHRNSNIGHNQWYSHSRSTLSIHLRVQLSTTLPGRFNGRNRHHSVFPLHIGNLWGTLSLPRRSRMMGTRNRSCFLARISSEQ
jgi:hypothetical protein